jgi:hypothetical protein
VTVGVQGAGVEDQVGAEALPGGFEVIFELFGGFFHPKSTSSHSDRLSVRLPATLICGYTDGPSIMWLSKDSLEKSLQSSELFMIFN